MKNKISQLHETQQRYLETIALSLRPGTVLNYRTTIKDFIQFLGSQHPQVTSFSQLERCHFEDWLKFLSTRALHANTKRSKIIRLRLFLENLQAWCWKDAPGEAQFRKKGDLPPEVHGLPKPLSAEVDRSLQEELHKRGQQSHKAILLKRATGLRAGELLRLEIDALRKLPKGEWLLHVPPGKTLTDRVIPVDEATAKIFRELCLLRGSPPPAIDPETGKPAHFLLMRPDGTRLRRSTLRMELDKIEKELHLSEHLHLHRLRHTYATQMLSAGMHLPVLMKLLGHRDIRMTLRYAEVTGVFVAHAFKSALTALEGRYKIPAPQTFVKLSGGKPCEIVDRLKSLAAQIESFRRDQKNGNEKKKLQRLIERLIRLTSDFQRLSFVGLGSAMSKGQKGKLKEIKR